MSDTIEHLKKLGQGGSNDSNPREDTHNVEVVEGDLMAGYAVADANVDDYDNNNNDEEDDNSNNPNKGDSITAVIRDLRERGNYEFRQSNFDLALSLYTAAIEECHKASNTFETNEVTTNTMDMRKSVEEELLLNLCNRSACSYRMELFHESCLDAQHAWERSNCTSVKAAYRFAKGTIALLQQHSPHAFGTDPTSTSTNCTQAGSTVDTINTVNTVNGDSVTLGSKNETVAAAKAMLQTAIQVLESSLLSTTITATGEGSNPSQENSISAGTAVKMDDDSNDNLKKQIKALKELWNKIVSLSVPASSLGTNRTISSASVETSIKYVQRPVSIREFTKGKELGYGNFSEIVIATCTATGERFALKMIEKKRAADLAKRQHPNVYNEIQMERRVLLERLNSHNRGHPGIVRMYHAFQDYNTLYYLMDLHTTWGDLWSELKYRFPVPSASSSSTSSVIMMGCHRTQAKQWLYELIDAIEYIHAHGIVHRDLKPENILLTGSGHILVIDFGTAKDLIETDLNGPEFVGTPDFMSPEAVTGDSGKPGLEFDGILPSDDADDEEQKTKQKKKRLKKPGASFEADLWALGAIAFILQTGHTPFWCPSPYLAFLKIQRSAAALVRPMGIVEDECWDFIQSLMKHNPKDRLGAGAFRVSIGNGKANTRSVVVQQQQANGGAYDVIRNHPYFDTLRQSIQLQLDANRIGPLSGSIDSSHNNHLTKIPLHVMPTPIPSLQDLCIRSVAIQAYRDSLDVDILEQHPPGNGNKQHDMTLLYKSMNNSQSTVGNTACTTCTPDLRAAVLHVLDRCQLLRTEPRLYGRFFHDSKNEGDASVASRLDRIRVASRDYVGLTQMNDDQCKNPHQQMNDPYAKPTLPPEVTKFVFLTSPLFTSTSSSACVTTDDTGNSSNDDEVLKRKHWKKLLKRSIATINRSRPKLVFVTAMNDVLRSDLSIRKLLSRISETIPVVVQQLLPDERKSNSLSSSYFTFWKMGIQSLVLQSSALVTTTSSNCTGGSGTDDNIDKESNRKINLDEVEQVAWIRSHLEQCRMSKYPLFAFVDNDPRSLPNRLLKKLARGRTLCLFGLIQQQNDDYQDLSRYESAVSYKANEMDDDNVSIRSISKDDDDDEEDDKIDSFTMQVRATNENGLYWISVDPNEADRWSVEFESIM